MWRKYMKTTKLVVGILMIIFSVFIIFQSSLVGVSDAFSGKGALSGSAGLLVAILYLASGIVYIVTRKSDKMGGDIAGLVMMLIAWITGLGNVGIYKDLQIWSWLAFIIGIGFFAWHKLQLSKRNK